MNKITKDMFPDQWADIVGEVDSLGEIEHRRGATFYVNPQYVLGEQDIEGHPELAGRWEGDTVTWSDDWGLDADPTELHRLEQKEVIIKKKEWVRVT